MPSPRLVALEGASTARFDVAQHSAIHVAAATLEDIRYADTTTGRIGVEAGRLPCCGAWLLNHARLEVALLRNKSYKAQMEESVELGRALQRALWRNNLKHEGFGLEFSIFLCSFYAPNAHSRAYEPSLDLAYPTTQWRL